MIDGDWQVTGTTRTKRSALLLIGCIAALFATGLGPSVLAQNPPAQAVSCTAAPDAPTELAASVQVASLTLTWRAADPGCAAETFLVDIWCECVTNGFAEEPTGTTATTYIREGLPSDAYRIQVRALNAHGKSAPSNDVRFTVARWGEHSTPDVVVAARTADRSTFFPTVERLKNGDLVVVYYDSPAHVSPLGRISLARSTDEGRHWSQPRVAIDTPNDDRDPSVMQLRDGTLLLSFFSVDRTQASPDPKGVFVARSNDDGLTWSAPAHVDTSLNGAATSAKIVELENGDLLLPYYGRPPNTPDARAAAIRSTDGGRTWLPASDVVLASRPGIEFSEPAIADLGGGRLIAVSRAEHNDFSSYLTRSDDGGRTWTPPARMGVAANAPDLLSVRIAGDPRVRWLYSYGELSSKFGEGRRTAMQMQDPDGRVQYAGPKVIYHGHCSWGDESYPSTVRMSETRFLTVYYDACAGIIGGTFSNLSELLQPR